MNLRCALIILSLSALASAQATDRLYDKTRLWDFRFTFPQSDWWNLLQASHTNNTPVKGDLLFDGVTYKDIGLKVKGFTSAGVGTKKPFNLSMDAFVPGQSLFGHKTINLNNAWRDPTFTREVLTYDLLSRYMPTPQTGYARVYLNNQLWGVYVMAEQINGDFLERFYDDPDGIRFKGDNPTRVALGSSTLQYSPSGYQNMYELKTSHANAWTVLGNAIDKLNRGTVANLEADVSSVINVDRALWYLAANNVVHNCDSYDTGGHNYYMYFDPATGLMNMVPWDCNYSFAVFKFFLTPGSYVQHDPLALSGSITGQRPLKERLLLVPKWRELYLAHIRTILDESYQWDAVMRDRNTAYQKVIADAVKVEPYPLHPLAWFTGNITQEYPNGSYTIPGLKTLVDARRAFLLAHPAINKPAPDITQVAFSPTTSQTPGQTVWVRAKVTASGGVGAVELRTAQLANAPFTVAPMFDDGQHQDGAANDGVYGASFKTAAAYDTVRFYIHATNTAGAIKRFPRAAEFDCLEIRTVPARPTGGVMINEVLADNATVDKDEAGEFEDWVELINNGNQAYDLSGHFLTDDLRNRKKWAFPANTRIPAKGFLRIWCDDEPADGPLHATFRLSDMGEVVGLADSSGVLMDAMFFGRQKEDRSYGSVPDGGLTLFHIFTPSAEAPVSGVGGGKVVGFDVRRGGSPSGFTLSSPSFAKVGNVLSLQLFGGPPNAAALVGIGLRPAHIDLGQLGPLLLDPALMVTTGVPLDPFGFGGLSASLPAGTAGTTVFVQAAANELSNGVVFTIAQ